MMVKICGITNREDALAAAESGASAIGLNFYRNSPRYVSPTGAALISAKLPAQVLKVGVFVDEAPDTIAHIVLQAGLDVAQLHGASQCPAVRSWRAVPVGDTFDLTSSWDAAAEALLLDTASSQLHGGTGRSFRWSLAREAGSIKRVIIAGGLDESNVHTAIEEAQPWGVDVCSRIEIEPGRKDHRRMARFIQAALATHI